MSKQETKYFLIEAAKSSNFTPEQQKKIIAIINTDTVFSIDDVRTFIRQNPNEVSNLYFNETTEQLRYTSNDKLADCEAYEEFTATDLFDVEEQTFYNHDIITLLSWLLNTNRLRMAVGVSVEPSAKDTKPEDTKPEDIVEETIAERGKVYGGPFESHKNIGMSWTALLQQHYGLTFEKPIPASLVAQMMVCFKMQRSARVYKDDNYIDAHAYTKFAEEFQKKEQGNEN